MRRKEIEETLSAVANRLYRIGDSESSHHSTTTSTETVGEEIQRLSFLIDKCVAALKIKEGDSQQTTNNARENICPKSAVLRSNHTLVCIEDGESCTGIVGACQDNERVYL